MTVAATQTGGVGARHAWPRVCERAGRLAGRLAAIPASLCAGMAHNENRLVSAGCMVYTEAACHRGPVSATANPAKLQAFSLELASPIAGLQGLPAWFSLWPMVQEVNRRSDCEP